MSYFNDVYLKRVNRFGTSYPERVMNQRRASFDRLLQKYSVYRIDFDYDGETYPALFERYKQDNTEIMRYLFTHHDLNIPNGTVLMLPDPAKKINEYCETEYETQDNPFVQRTEWNERPWMIYYLEDSSSKGYNRYILLKMTHFLKWKDRQGVERESYAYMYGQEDNMLMDEIRSRSRMDTIYSENLKSSFFVMPANPHIRKDDYFIIDKDINNKVLEEYYRVTGYDIQSQDNVEYVTVDPVYEYDLSPAPEKKPTDEDKDFYWFTGGIGGEG